MRINFFFHNHTIETSVENCNNTSNNTYVTKRYADSVNYNQLQCQNSEINWFFFYIKYLFIQ